MPNPLHRALALTQVLTLFVGACDSDTKSGSGPRAPAPPSKSGASAPPPSDPPAPAQATDPEPPTTSDRQFTGLLRGDIMGIGGESTGWLLEDCEQRGGKAIEVDPGAATAQARAAKNKKVTITGKIVTHSYTERGEVVRLVAESIEALP